MAIRIPDSKLIPVSLVNVFLFSLSWNILDQVPWKTHRDWCARGIQWRVLSGTRPIWDEGSRPGQKEKPNSKAAALKAFTNPMGSPGAGMTFRGVLTGGEPLSSCTNHSVNNWARQPASGRDSPWRGVLQLALSSWKNCPIPDGDSGEGTPSPEAFTSKDIYFWMKNKNLLTIIYWAPSKFSRQILSKLASWIMFLTGHKHKDR